MARNFVFIIAWAAKTAGWTLLTPIVLRGLFQSEKLNNVPDLEAKFKFPYLVATLASSLLAIAAFPPFDFSLMAWIALVPLLAVIPRVKRRWGLAYGFIWGLVFYSGGLYWFMTIFGAFGFLLIMVLATFTALFAFIVSSLKKRFGNLAAAALAPFIWTGVEFFRSELWTLKFAWLGMGYTQHASLTILQSADLFGVYGISFALLSVNSSVALIVDFLLDRKDKKYPYFPGPFLMNVFSVLLIALMFVYGVWSLQKVHLGRPVKFVGVQFESGWYDELIELSEKAIKNGDSSADIIVWPEYSTPFILEKDPEPMDRLTEFAAENDVYFIFGGRDSGDEANSFKNTAFVLSRKGEIIGRAVKMNPIPFFMDGEPGKDFTVVNTEFGKAGVAICYDMDYSYVSRGLVSNGAEILIFPTMDAFIWGRSQHLQHAAMSSLRAVENRRWLFRVASSGVSQMVDAHGRILSETEIGEIGHIVAEGVFIKEKSFYSRFGHYFSWLCLVVTASSISAPFIVDIKKLPKRPR